MIRLVVFVVLLALGMNAPVHAASFDCGKAATPFEKAICGDPELSAADERLARTYATAIGGLSEGALGALRADQRAWLDFAQRACTRDAKPLTSGTYDERGIRCLTNLFLGRSRTLEQSRMMDGLRFYPLGRYAALPDPYEAEDPDSSWPVGQHELSYIQLDGGPDYAEAFNEFIEAEALKLSNMFAAQGGPDDVAEDGSSDTDNSITVKEVTGTRITLDVGTYWFGHGAAHGNWTRTYLHYLVEEDRALVAKDIFAGKAWRKALLDLVVEALKAEHGDMLMLDDTQYIAESVIDPARWDLSDPYNLIVQFQPYEVSAYAYGAPTARVRWEDLTPHLAETADAVRYGY